MRPPEFQPDLRYCRCEQRRSRLTAVLTSVDMATPVLMWSPDHRVGRTDRRLDCHTPPDPPRPRGDDLGTGFDVVDMTVCGESVRGGATVIVSPSTV